MENQLDSVTEKPTCFLRLQGLACHWSKQNKHSRNIFSVHGFLCLSVIITVTKTRPIKVHIHHQFANLNVEGEQNFMITLFCSHS